VELRPLVLAVLLALLAGVGPAGAHDADVTHRDTIQQVNFDFVGAIEGAETSIASGYGDAGLTYLPLRWCGTPRATDDTVDQVQDPKLPQVKFIYARASDQEDRTLVWADLLQANASLISRFYAQQSGGLRAPRLDLGTDCGADYLDVTTVHLPQPRAAYVDSFDAVEAAVDAALPRTSAQPRIYVILADKLSSYGSGSLWGQGSYYGADAKGTSNVNNNGGVTSIIWIPQAQTLPSTSAAKDQGFWPEGFLHELTHNFGGVQRTAPNTSGAGHCTDGRDVMCYADGGANSYNPSVCPMLTSFTTQFAQTLDCGRDDYFSPSPTPASWLDTHFNTFDNVFNGDCPALRNQCGGGVAPGVTGGPSISGALRDGQTLTATPGVWTGGPALVQQWEEEVGGTWLPYAHNGLTLTLSAANVGRRYRIKVTAVGAETVVARSHPTATVGSKLTPRNSVRPSISGSARNGATLTADPGTWVDAASFAYQWFRVDSAGASEAIAGATGATYVLGADDIGDYIRLRVTATSPDGLTAQSTSTLLGPVVTAPINTSLPTISGTAKVGRTLYASRGSWTSATTYAYEWQREVATAWEVIPDAGDSLSYLLTAAEAGLRVRVLVKATNANGTTTVPTAPTSAVVALAPPVNLVAPVAAGTAQQGQTLTAQGDTWTGSPSTTAKWERRVSGGDWTAIGGSTGRTYVLAAADVDAEVRAVVTATNADGSAAASSPARGPVVTNVAPLNTVAPQVDGEARTGRTLTANPGTWLRATSFAYAWQRLSGGTWSPIAGATAGTYVPVAADAGLPLRVLVTATGWGGSATAPSAQTAAIGHPPQLQSLPAISGVAGVFRKLTASPGAWLNAVSYEYQWQRGDGPGWEDIPGATGSAYEPDFADEGRAIRVRVTAVNAAGPSDPAASTATAEVGGIDPPGNLAEPVVTGTLYQGETLTVGGDQWRGAETVRVQWQHRPEGGEFADIAGATARTYELTAADAGGDVRAIVTATNFYGEIPAESAPRGPVDGDPAARETPVVSGTPRIGETLRATPGVWLGIVSHAYQWERQEDRLPEGSVWTPIPGATASTYVPVAADAGLELRVVVTATGSRASASAPSVQTAAVISPPVMHAPPVVTGTAKRGETVRASPGTWAAVNGFTYRWEREVDDAWTAIDGATGEEYAPREVDLGRRLRVRVTATGAHGEVEAVSGATAPVADLKPPVNVAPPVVIGTLHEGQTLGVTEGTWTGAVSRSVVWQRRTGIGEWTTISTESTYVLQAADAGADVRAVVTAKNGDGETTATSAARGPVVARPVVTVIPVVSGTPRLGHTLTATSGTWSWATTYEYAWQRRAADGEWSGIPGAHGTSYTVGAGDVRHALRAVVTASNSAGSRTAASAWTAAADAPPVNTAPPAVEGDLYAGETLTAAGDRWTGDPATSVVWQRRAGGGEWAAIPGATGRTYTIAAADAGHDVRVLVTAVNDAGETVSASAARGPVRTQPVTDPPLGPGSTPGSAQEPVTPAPSGGGEEATGQAPRTTGYAVALRTGRRAAGKVTVTVTGSRAAITGRKLKLRAGRYTARLCAGSKCVTGKVKVRGGRLAVAGLALPASAGQIVLTLEPARGKVATGRFVLAAG
jgi:hypothetical protein